MLTSEVALCFYVVSVALYSVNGQGGQNVASSGGKSANNGGNGGQNAANTDWRRWVPAAFIGPGNEGWRSYIPPAVNEMLWPVMPNPYAPGGALAQGDQGRNYNGKSNNGGVNNGKSNKGGVNNGKSNNGGTYSEKSNNGGVSNKNKGRTENKNKSGANNNNNKSNGGAGNPNTANNDWRRWVPAAFIGPGNEGWRSFLPPALNEQLGPTQNPYASGGGQGTAGQGQLWW